MNDHTCKKYLSPNKPLDLDLDLAIDDFLRRGGTIDRVQGPVCEQAPAETGDHSPLPEEEEQERTRKTELLRELITKGAGICALQYSLKMNKNEIKRMARENGLKITQSRSLHLTRKYRTSHSATAEFAQDAIAGHAMHYCALGYTAIEIAQKLDLTVRQVCELGKNYRFELNHRTDNRDE
ncbi:hypothetical protein HX870_25215 [Pseudomonas gingeri]|uniref:Uncharacterized protein n=1 Tax=Pseudomonas gingeri TaxID=117681 RepID=A0A7Y7XE05_9PSED|nr:hypothetical protein [Pseudomonas gingeri]NWA27065.1 hypothetical protein [Pseudomonas gingeri]NWB98153.1 hypothetical protein [Pseudomonas gingeri]NWD70902.1 hypothetical protein [Pseudomonas gingeri]NWD73007.1 hypothetical protein [Pseudomonas gingeri]